MFKRFICGLSRPKDIINYANDKFYHSMLVILLMVVLYLIPVVYYSVTTSVVSPSDITQIRYAFNRTRDCEYIIEDNTLKYVGSSEGDVTKVSLGEIDLVFTLGSYSQNDITKATILFHEKGLYYVYGNFQVYELKYSEIEILNGIDFRNAKTNDEGFWTKIETIVYGIGDSLKPVYVTTSILVNIFMMVMEVLIMSLLIGFIYRVNAEVKFSQGFRMAIITCVPYFLGSFFTVIFNNYLFNYIFIGYTLFISVSCTNHIRKTRGVN